MKKEIKIEDPENPEEPDNPTPPSSCTTINVDPCNPCNTTTINDVEPLDAGVLINVTANLKNLCPNRTISIAAVLCKDDKVVAVQVKEKSTGSGSGCKTANETFHFAVKTKCGDRDTFKVKIIAHYSGSTNCPCPCSI